MSTRLGHKKSKGGCAMCKRRRVKCNEQHPCHNCDRRGEQCTFISKTTTTTTTTPVSYSSVDTSTPRPAGNSDPFDFLPTTNQQKLFVSSWTQDLLLMHHYSTYTYKTLTTRSSNPSLWETFIPQQALDHPFLMHGILALASTHLCYIHPTDHYKYSALSSHHQNKSITQLRGAILKVTNENCSAVFASACILSIVSMTTLSLPTEIGLEEPVAAIDDILQLFILTRGVRDVLAPCLSQIETTPFSNHLNNHPLKNYGDVSLPPQLREPFDRLLDMIHQLCQEATDYSACTVALSELGIVYKDIWFLDQSEVEVGTIIKWTTSLPASFLSLLRTEHHSAALIILAHFVILFKVLQSTWHVNRWSERAFFAVKAALPPAHASRWLVWPEEQLKAGLTAFATVS